MRRLLKYGVLLIVFFVTPICFVSATHIYLDTETKTHGNLDTFYIPVRVDVQKGECINSVKVSISYNPSEISIKDISIADSILSLWTQKPSIKKTNGEEDGMIAFEGGIPGGYCGRVVGDPGKTDVLVKLVVAGAPGVLADNEAKTANIIVEPSTKVYLNDGFGSEADLTVAGLELVLRKSTTTPNNVWLSDIKSDNIAPELFDITLIKGPSQGNKKSYIIFNTVDKQSGIDHYEVLETDPDRFGFLALFPNKESHWVFADSPYVLRDQKLHSKIMVKAVDKNGNERVIEYMPPISAITTLTQVSIFIPIVIILFVIFVLFVFVLKWKKNRRNDNKNISTNYNYESSDDNTEE